MSLVLSDREINKRRQTIERVFKPLTPTGHVEVFVRTSPHQFITGLGQNTFGNNPRAARHRCRISNVFINYYEIWGLRGRTQNFLLEKAYFHLDAPKPNGLGDEEIIAIHCDGDAVRTDEAFVYKRGPHIHVSGNNRNISKSHIALCLNDIERTCSDFKVYSEAFAGIIKMVGDEILPRI